MELKASALLSQSLHQTELLLLMLTDFSFNSLQAQSSPIKPRAGLTLQRSN